MANGVTSEWEDIHVRLGNYLPREKVVTTAETSMKSMEKGETLDPMSKKDMTELKKLEDDFDEDYLEEFRKKRMEEMKAAMLKPKFGFVLEINKQEYIAEVTNAPKDVFVVIHLYQNSYSVSEYNRG